MADNTKISKNPSLDLPVESVVSRIIDRKFGLPEDYIEAHIYNQNNQLLTSINNFTDFTKSADLANELSMDPVSILNNNGYSTGEYKLVFNILRKKIFNTTNKTFVIKEISPSRTELRATAKDISNNDLKQSSQQFINEISNSPFLRDFILNFGENRTSLGVNIILNEVPSTNELLIKLNEPLPNNISTLSNFSIAEEITSQIIIDQDLGSLEFTDSSIPLKGPNFKIDVRLNSSIPSEYRSYNDILKYESTSSYQNLLSKLENREVPEIQYDYVRTSIGANEGDPIVETYHFENFVHFGSALERVKNFKHKMELLEIYNSQMEKININLDPQYQSSYTINEFNNINNKKTNLLKGLDGYEKFLYYESGAYSWPKTTLKAPHTLYSIESPAVKTWLGDERDTYSNYGGQLLSASKFDKQNDNSLVRLVPNHIIENPDNSFYTTFVNMMGHHYDQIWAHIKHLTEVNDSHHTKGISKDLVYHSLKSLGLETFDQFENSNLIEYILGEGSEGSAFYDVPSGHTLITASNAGSIPKENITKEIWKRLYHNAPYLLKTKGTERGLKALMSCYGVPATILNVKEYGGSSRDKTTYKTFSYEKSGLALKGDSGTNGYFIKTAWSSSLTNVLSSSAKTVEFRIKPSRSNDNYHLWSLLGSPEGTSETGMFQSLILEPYIGNDILVSGDAEQYGRLKWSHNNGASGITTTDYFPIYNGDFWDIFIGIDAEGVTSTPTTSSNALLKFGAYQSNHLKSINYYTASNNSKEIKDTHANWGLDVSTTTEALRAGASYCYIGGMESSVVSNDLDGIRYLGSIQEVRYHFGELLSHETLKQHALEPFMYSGNTPSSSYENLVLRLPLGSNDFRDFKDYHPNSNIYYLTDSLNPTASSDMSSQTWEEVIETHHLPTPDTVGISTTSEKTRIDTGTVDDNWLSVNKKGETSTQDRQPLDYPDVGVFFSPTNEINEDILYTLGSFRLDDYIGSPLPSAQTASVYEGLADIKDIYFKKVKRRFNYWDYTKLIQQIDHTLFKLIEQWVPMKVNLKTGLLIEPHYLERTKFKRNTPIIEYGQSMLPNSYNTFEFGVDTTPYGNNQISLESSSVITTNNLSQTTSNRQRQDQGTNCTININEYILNEVQQTTQAPINPKSREDQLRFSDTFLYNPGSSEIDTANSIRTGWIDNIEGTDLIGGGSKIELVSDQGHVSGSYALRVGNTGGTDDALWLVSKTKIPYNSDTVYELETRIKGASSGECYVGFVGYDLVGNLSNVNGLNQYGNAHYTAVSSSVLSGNNWETHKGYVRGFHNSFTSLTNNQLYPTTMRLGITHISPIIIFNYLEGSTPTGTSYIDYLKITEQQVNIDDPNYQLYGNSKVLLGNATKGKTSSRYYRRLVDNKELNF